MLFAAVSVGVMIYVLVTYGLREDPPPKSMDSQPHAGAEHFTAASVAHQGDRPSPLEVYADSKVGDWQAYRVTTESSLAPTITATVVARIAEVSDATVRRTFAGRLDATGEVRDDRDEERPRRGLTIDQLTGNDVGGWTIHDLRVTEESHEIGGRSFACKKLDYASDDPLIDNKQTHAELWISAEVPAGGLVEEREIQQMPTMRFVITKQLIGFGDASGTTWGTRPDGL